MIPPTKSYTTVPAPKISAKIAAALPEIPTVVSDLISQHAVTNYAEALKPLQKNVNDVALNRAIQDAFASSECDPTLKVDIIYLAIQHGCCEKLRLLLAELLDSGQDVYLNNTKFITYGCHLGWLFLRKNLIGTATVLPNFGRVHFSGADLGFVFLDCCYLPGAIFTGAKFGCTGLSGAFLYGADFSESDVFECHFQVTPKHVKLSEGDEHGFYMPVSIPTNLSYATFANSDVGGSNFSKALMVNTNLAGVKNCDKANFSGAEQSSVTLVEPPFPQMNEASIHSKWSEIYVQAYNTVPTRAQLAVFKRMLANYHPDALLPHAAFIGKLGERFADFVEFSKLPGGQLCDKNLWLIEQGVRPAELAAYNRLREQHRSRPDVIKLIKDHRQR